MSVLSKNGILLVTGSCSIFPMRTHRERSPESDTGVYPANPHMHCDWNRTPEPPVMVPGSSRSWVRLTTGVTYVSLQLRMQNAVSAQPCVGKFQISLVLLNFLHCNFRLWFKTP